MKKTIKAAGLLMALLLVAVSCEGNGAVPGQAMNSETITVSFSKLVAKSVEEFSVGTVSTPALDDIWFQYKAEKADSTGSPTVIGATEGWADLGTGKGLTEPINLSRGTWNLSLRGFASEEKRSAAGNAEDGTEAIFIGTASDTAIGTDLSVRAQSVDMTLEFTNPAGLGSYKLQVTVPDQYASGNAKVTISLEGGSASSPYTHSESLSFETGILTKTFTIQDIPNGVVGVTLSCANQAGERLCEDATDSMLIMTGMETSGHAVIGEDDTFEITINGASPSETPESGFPAGASEN